MKRDNTDYWVQLLCCINNAFYNVYYLENEKTHRVRCGRVIFNGKAVGRLPLNVSVREFDYSDTHCWVESKDGKYIIDWVLCKELDRKVKVYEKAEIEKLGFKYQYYENEKGIFNKLKRRFGKEGDLSRSVMGDM